jgi:mRNA interferase MazF
VVVSRTAETLRQGDIVWADFGEPRGSAPGYLRPVVIVQSDPINRSRIGTVVCIPLASNLLLANAPGNLLLRRSETGLPKDSVVNVSQISSLDWDALGERIGSLGQRHLEAIFRGLDIVLGR